MAVRAWIRAARFADIAPGVTGGTVLFSRRLLA